MTNERRTGSKKLTGFALARRMIRLVGPLRPVEIRAIACGTLQHLVATGAVACATVGLFRAFGSGSMAVRTGIGTRTGTATGPWLPWIIAAIVLIAIRGLFSYAEQLSNHQMAFSTLRDIRTTVLDQIRRLSPAKLEGRGRGNLVAVVTQDIELLEIFYAHTLSPIAIAILSTLACTAAIACADPGLGLIALVSYLIVGLAIPWAFASPMARQARSGRQTQGRLRSRLLEALENRRMIASFGAGQNVSAQLDGLTATMADARHRGTLLSGADSLAGSAAMLVGIAAFAADAAFLLHSGRIAAIAAFAAFAIFATSFPPLLSIARLGTGLQPTIAAARRVFSLLDERPAVQEVPDGKGVRFEGFDGLEAHDLAFSYPDQSYPDQGTRVLDGVDLSIRPGEVIGIEGRNGAGKSTLLSILLRFRDRTGGSLAINGTPIERVETSSLRRLETLVSQDTYIFTDTLAANIALGRPSASREEIERAARDACLDDVIDELDGGLDHVLVRHGSELSEGEKQRIAVARALLSCSALILLDEPTSNMDALLEGRILRSLLGRPTRSGNHGTSRNTELGTNQAAYVIVSHRPAVLAAIRRVPNGRVFALEEGHLVEK